MKAPRILIALAAIVSLMACSGTAVPVVQIRPTAPSDAGSSQAPIGNGIRNASREAIIYNGVWTALELLIKLTDGDELSNGQTLHSAKELSAIYRAETPALTQGPEPELGTLTREGTVVYKGSVVADRIDIVVRRTGGNSYPTGFTTTSPETLLASYGVDSMPVLVYLVRDRIDPTRLNFVAGIVTAGGEIVKPLIPRPPRGPAPMKAQHSVSPSGGTPIGGGTVVPDNTVAD